MLMQNFGATNKEHYGMLWYFLEWSICAMRVSEGGLEPPRTTGNEADIFLATSLNPFPRLLGRLKPRWPPHLTAKKKQKGGN